MPRDPLDLERLVRPFPYRAPITIETPWVSQMIEDMAEPGKRMWEGDPFPALAGGLSGLAVPGSASFTGTTAIVTQVLNSIAATAMSGLFAGALRGKPPRAAPPTGGTRTAHRKARAEMLAEMTALLTQTAELLRTRLAQRARG